MTSNSESPVSHFHWVHLSPLILLPLAFIPPPCSGYNLYFSILAWLMQIISCKTKAPVAKTKAPVTMNTPPSAAFMDLSNLSLTQDEQNQVNTKEEETSNTSHLRTRRYTLAKMWQGRRPRTILQGLRADRTTRRRAAKHRHSTRRRDKQKTEATREERPGQAEGDRQAD